jgi:hypothetical protein
VHRRPTRPRALLFTNVVKAHRCQAIEVLTATGEREATIAATEQCASAALQAMITGESLTVSEAVQWCVGAISHREATRLRHLSAGPQQPE